MNPTERIAAGLAELARTALAAQALAPAAAAVAATYAATLRRGGTLFFAGNGGSAADAQHLATEYVVRFRSRRPAYAAVALTTDTSLITAAGNDLGFEHIFSRQVEALGKPGDVLVLHSTSGASANLLAAADTARSRELVVAAFLGKGGGPLLALADHAVVIPSDDVSRIQEMHLALEHLIVEAVEEELNR